MFFKTATGRLLHKQLKLCKITSEQKTHTPQYQITLAALVYHLLFSVLKDEQYNDGKCFSCILIIFYIIFYKATSGLKKSLWENHTPTIKILSCKISIQFDIFAVSSNKIIVVMQSRNLCSRPILYWAYNGYKVHIILKMFSYHKLQHVWMTLNCTHL